MRPRAPPAARRHRLPPSPASTASTSSADEVHLADGAVLALRRAGRRHRRACSCPRRPRGSTGPGLDGEGLHLLRPRGRRRARRRARRASTAAASSSTSSTCRSSARSRRSSSASWPTGTSTSAASATGSQLTYVTPLDGAFTKPVASQHARRDARREGHRARHRVQHRRGRRRRRPARRLRRARGPVRPGRRRSRCTAAPRTSAARPGLGDELDFVPTDEHTLQSKAAPNVFVIGDAANVPGSKAGSVTHFEGEMLVENVRALPRRRAARGRLRRPRQLLHRDRASTRRCSSTSTTTPSRSPGHFPAAVGLPLLKESRLNHLGKLMFQWFYWHGLLPGRDIPGIGSTMPTAGKRTTPTTDRERTDDDDHDHRRRRRRRSTTKGFFVDPEQWTEDDGARARPAETASTS